MKRGIIFGLLILCCVLTASKTASALSSFSSLLPQFGGRIIFPKAIQIQTLEAIGYNCFVPGSTLSIIPIGSPPGTPTSYFIPSFVTSKTGTIPTAGQLIIGKYSVVKTPIPCMLSVDPYTVTTVYLSTVTLFGTSRI